MFKKKKKKTPSIWFPKNLKTPYCPKSVEIIWVGENILSSAFLEAVFF